MRLGRNDRLLPGNPLSKLLPGFLRQVDEPQATTSSRIVFACKFAGGTDGGAHPRQLEFNGNDLAIADEATQRLLENRDGQPTPADLVLATEVSLRERQFDKASALAQKALASPSATRRDQLQATIALDSIVRNGGASLGADPRQIDARLVEMGGGHDDVSLQALIALA